MEMKNVLKELDKYYSFTEIGDEVGYSRKTVARLYKRHGVTGTHKNKYVIEKNREDFEDLLDFVFEHLNENDSKIRKSTAIYLSGQANVQKLLKVHKDNLLCKKWDKNLKVNSNEK